jgi:adenine deaminase
VNAAQALGLGDELGTVQPGKIADLAFIGGDPLVDIHNTRDVKRVMKAGAFTPLRDSRRNKPRRTPSTQSKKSFSAISAVSAVRRDQFPPAAAATGSPTTA